MAAAWPMVRSVCTAYVQNALSTDLCDVEGSYMRAPDSCFWVAEAGGAVGPSRSPGGDSGSGCPSTPPALLKNSARREKSPGARPLLEIYSASGLLLAAVPGTVLIYNLFCEFKRHFSMGNEVLQNHVLEAKVFHTEYGTGVAILTGAHRFSLATNIDDLKLRRMPEVPGLQKPPSCWAVLSQDRVTMVLLAVGQDLYLLDNTSCSVVTPPGLSPSAGAYLQLAVSFNHRCLALFTDTGYLWMGLATLKEKICEFNCSIRSPPRQMVWRQRSFVLDEDSFLVPELDGVRILSRSSHEFLHEIPEASQEIFRIASMAPGALLLEAQKEYEKESQKADEYLREIKDQKLLPEAVSQCIEAAGYEHEPETQKSLLRAASFGKCFLDKFPPDGFVRMCQDLRVLNAVRDYQIGIPLTFTQYKRLTIEVLLDRLVLRRLYPLAIRICEYLRLSEIQGVSRILAHWACYKVQQKDKCAEEVAQAINQKLGDTPGISYSEIAARAYDCGRTELAIKRLEGRVGALQNAVDEYYKAKNEFAAKATEEQIKLLRLQRHLQEDLDKPYLDLSLHDTVTNLILDGHHKRAEQLYREFKIPDKRYWWLKISALATRGDWEEMEKFSKSKKSPIGYLPFVEIAVKHHN
ncbi:hypothetical protein A306_00014557, partial [Columba livia]